MSMWSSGIHNFHLKIFIYHNIYYGTRHAKCVHIKDTIGAWQLKYCLNLLSIKLLYLKNICISAWSTYARKSSILYKNKHGFSCIYLLYLLESLMEHSNNTDNICIGQIMRVCSRTAFIKMHLRDVALWYDSATFLLSDRSVCHS